MFRVLFVCTGNTCRSPLAEIIASDLSNSDGLDFSSAGVHALDGGGASSGALEIARENGLDLEGFKSRTLTEEIVDEADLVLVMEPVHRSGVLGISPRADTKTHLLGDFAGATSAQAWVPDPFGGSTDSYRRVFHKIKQHLGSAVERIRELAASRPEQA